MSHECSSYFPRLDAWIDGELDPPEAQAVGGHVAACPACRAEADSRRRLKAALARLVLPELRRPARRWIPAAAAAALLLALLLLAVPGATPKVVALSVELHDRYLRGELAPGGAGLKIAVPGAEYVGHCACPPDLGAASPFIVYRKDGVPLSLLILEGEIPPLPDSARRSLQGREVWAFRRGAATVVVCPAGKLSHVWTSRLDEAALLATISVTREGRTLLSGERLTLEGLS
jgi:hypothetical protein